MSGCDRKGNWRSAVALALHCSGLTTYAIQPVEHTTYMPILRNQLPASRRQPRTNLSNSDSPSPMSGTSIGSIDSPLSSSVTTSLFHSKLKTSLFGKSFLPQLLFFFGTHSTHSPDCLPILLSISVFLLFLVFPLFSFRFRAVDQADLCQLLSTR